MSGVVSALSRLGLWGRGAVIAMPFLWLLLFFLVPFLIVFGISFSESIVAQPPYAPLVGWLTDEESGTTKLQILLNLTNYLRLTGDDLYILAYLNSVKIALVTTLLCLAIGYPMAYAIAKADPARRGPLMMLVILPFWTSFLIRIYAWIGILKSNGVISNLLEWTGITSGPVEILYSDWAVYIGMTYCYLPFMVLPLYSTLEKMDPTLLEAAADLGCRPLKAFLTVTLPLSLPGIIAGSLLVFIPAVGEFVTPELLGGPDTLMIGRVLWNEFFANRDWPVASGVAIALLLVLVVPIMIFQYVQGREAEER
ncbi:ABC transporter permease subunit [Azospirillum cavernae]|uniref:ABC transporter permease subunit n=1 Tax=Azospirillum cavernae TaxID=2320860 RepID=A0A418VM24_9PROT|nr:ABC transporter permease subunit [Azospirillum cavernae]RJF77230.1 ABC transporter permease subunit [Azospirillum cavernae]